MADEASNIPSPFDLQSIRYLVQLMSRHDLHEIDLRQGELRIRLRRGAKHLIQPQLPVQPAATVPPTAPAPAAATEPEKPARPFHEIKSPAIGTYYSAPSPDAEPFVRIGSRVTPTTVVCTIEAMKIFNEIPADCSGVITEVCLENQQSVEFGQVLFKVDPTG